MKETGLPAGVDAVVVEGEGCADPIRPGSHATRDRVDSGLDDRFAILLQFLVDPLSEADHAARQTVLAHAVLAAPVGLAGIGEGTLTWRTSVRSSSRGMPREVKRAFGSREVVLPSIEARVSARP